MAARKRKQAAEQWAERERESAGIPYEIDGKRVSLAEYRAHTRAQRRARVVAELRGETGESDPGESA